MTSSESKLDRQSIEQILARAVELDDQRSGALTVDQLREIAAELAISKEAVNRALEEHRHDMDLAGKPIRVAEATPARPRRGLLIVVAIAVALVAALVFLVAVRVVIPIHPPS